LVLVLGACGRNFAAGMSGGIAYVFDEKLDFSEKRCNLASVDLEPVVAGADARILRDLLTRHLHLTGSQRAQWILDHWPEMLSRFIKVFPHEYKRVQGIPRGARPYVPVTSVLATPQLATASYGQVRHG